MAQELKELKQNIESVSAQVTGIKLTHVHDVSVFTETFCDESDAGSKISQQTEDTSRRAIPNLDPTPTKQITTPTSTTATGPPLTTTTKSVKGPILSTRPPSYVAPFHIHPVACNSTTCTTDHIINVVNHSPNENTTPNATQVDQQCGFTSSQILSQEPAPLHQEPNGQTKRTPGP